MGAPLVWARKNNKVRNARSRSSMVIDFGTNRNPVCNFLLVIKSNLGPIFPHLRDIAGFFVENSDSTSTPAEFCGLD